MRLVFAGTPAAAVASLTALLESRHEVAAVVTRPDAPAGPGAADRGQPGGRASPSARAWRCSSRAGSVTRSS